MLGPVEASYERVVLSVSAAQGVLKLTKAEKDQRTEAAVSAAIGQVVAFERQLYGKRILCAEDMFDALDRDKSGAWHHPVASRVLVLRRSLLEFAGRLQGRLTSMSSRRAFAGLGLA